MLVLSRKKNEVVHIGDDVTITIVEIRGDKVRLGFEAPNHVQIHRKEVYDAIERKTCKGQAGDSVDICGTPDSGKASGEPSGSGAS